MRSLTRRRFLKQAAAASSVFPLVAVAGTKASGRVLGANDVIRVGVAGIHGQGNAHIDQYL
ncbi:MAG: gfo/Idh/MocA family oxidoreductase, partial [Planctomycetes bacterium]|nr:gfo/Idh/MocA family oxidoreductase [Planctomycetota bacterium]